MIKKLLLLGLGIVLLVGLPLAIFVLQNQTQTNTKAAASTKFTFDVPANPVNVGDSFDVPINVDPGGVNAVSFVKVTFTYDGTKLDKGSDTPVTIDSSKYTILEQPAVNCNDSNVCTVSFTISVGSNNGAIIKTKTSIASIKLVAKANTDSGSPTHLTFVAGQNQALSTGASDQAAENVFQGGTDGLITIGTSDGGGGSGPTDTPTPTSADNGGGGGDTTPTDAPTPTVADNGGGGSDTGGGSSDTTNGTDNSVTVSCSSFTADTKQGNAPLSVTFTTVGSATNDSVTKISINYGDGGVDSLDSGSGIGTDSVNAQTTHSYAKNGTFTATATLTTSSGTVSNPSSCSQTITVGSGMSGNLPPTGPGETILFVGAAGAVLTILGFALVAGL